MRRYILIPWQASSDTVHTQNRKQFLLPTQPHTFREPVGVSMLPSRAVAPVPNCSIRLEIAVMHSVMIAGDGSTPVLLVGLSHGILDLVDSGVIGPVLGNKRISEQPE